MPVNNALTPEGQNSLGAAFGYFPQLRRNRTVQDPRLAAEMPLQFLRGRTAATLGAPSDILNFLRSPLPMEVAGDVDYGPQAQVPYGSQELLRTLPLPPQGPAQAAAGNVGAVVPLTPTEALAAARAARQAALATGKAVGPTAERMAADYLQRQGLMPGVLPTEGRSFQYPQEEALRLAQQRAALPVEQGGLGLPTGNTAEQRAAAMGFNTDLYHGTTDPTIKRFDPSLAGKKSSNPFDENVFATTSPQNAGGYALNWNSYKKNVETSPAFQALSNQESSIARQFADLPAGPSPAKQDLSAQLESVRLQKNQIYNDFMEGKHVSEDATIYPLKARSQDFFPYDAAGKNWIRANRPAIDAAQQAGFEGTAIQNVKDNAGRWTDVVADSYATTNPDLFRSRFAAFDPFRRNAAIAAATGAIAPDLLAAQAEQDAYSKNELRKFKRQSAR